MIDLAVLSRAKACLCWEQFDNLTIQLIEIRESTAYFHPPVKRNTIFVFYQRGIRDFRIPLFHLFHEAGHARQHDSMVRAGLETEFRKAMENPTGPERVAFEQEASAKGGRLLETFVSNENLDYRLIAEYRNWADRAARSYE